MFYRIIRICRRCDVFFIDKRVKIISGLTCYKKIVRFPATLFQNFGYENFGMSKTVGISCINKSNSLINGFMDRFFRFFVISLSPITSANSPGTETYCGYGVSGFSKYCMFHENLLYIILYFALKVI